jgi:hypothetical protein
MAPGCSTISSTTSTKSGVKAGMNQVPRCYTLMRIANNRFNEPCQVDLPMGEGRAAPQVCCESLPTLPTTPQSSA